MKSKTARKQGNSKLTFVTHNPLSQLKQNLTDFNCDSVEAKLLIKPLLIEIDLLPEKENRSHKKENLIQKIDHNVYYQKLNSKYIDNHQFTSELFKRNSPKMVIVSG